MKHKQLLGGLTVGVLLLTITIATEGKAQTNNFCPQNLSQQIDRIIDQTEGHWGIMIQSQDSEEIIYQRNSEAFFIPASNTKLFTSAIALGQFNPEFKITTPVYQKGNPPTLENLQIIGQGDPSLTTRDLKGLADNLQEAGVEEIETVVLETGYFSKPYFPSSWEWEDVYASYGSPANSLILDENSVNLTLMPTKVGEDVNLAWENAIAASQWDLDATVITTSAESESNLELQRQLGTDQLSLTGELPENQEKAVWGFSIPNPDHYFRDALLVALSEHNIQVNNIKFSESQDKKGGEEIMRFKSPPLSELLKEININSNNLYAEALLKILMASAEEEIIEDSLTAFGINKDSYQFVDGSGLSRRNFVTPSAIAQLLQTMLQIEHHEVFQSSLPIAGVNGTLQNRFQQTPLEGKIQAKTGTMTGVSALSGYVELPNYQPLVFSLMVNHYQDSTSEKREIMDEILLLLPRLEAC